MPQIKKNLSHFKNEKRRTPSMGFTIIIGILILFLPLSFNGMKNNQRVPFENNHYSIMVPDGWGKNYIENISEENSKYYFTTFFDKNGTPFAAIGVIDKNNEIIKKIEKSHDKIYIENIKEEKEITAYTYIDNSNEKGVFSIWIIEGIATNKEIKKICQSIEAVN